jgi:hypothetical protein
MATIINHNEIRKVVINALTGSINAIVKEETEKASNIVHQRILEAAAELSVRIVQNQADYMGRPEIIIAIDDQKET